MNHVCSKCLHSDAEGFVQKYFPQLSTVSKKRSDFQKKILEHLMYPTTVCEKYHKDLAKFDYVMIDMRNPLLSQESFLGLRNLLKVRRQCHKLYDRLQPDKIPKFSELLEKQLKIKWEENNTKFADFDHLVLREHVLAFDELLDLPYLKNKLEFLYKEL